MKVILLSVLGTLALGSLSGISISHKDNAKLTENKLNANYDLDNDPYTTYSSVVYNVDLDKQHYFTGHGNPDWYRIEDEVQVTDVIADDYKSVEYLSITNYTGTSFFNVQVEFYGGTFSVSLASHSSINPGQVIINYRFHDSRKIDGPTPDSDYDDIDDSVNELPPIYAIDDDSGNHNDWVHWAKRVYNTGYIKGTINTYNWWIAFWNGNDVDVDWYVFSIQYKLNYTFKFTAPNNEYKFSLYPYKDKDKTPAFNLFGVSLNTTKSKTVTLYPGTYYMRVTVGNKDYVRDDKYTIDYNCAKPANDKLLLKPHIFRSAKMALWTNDILSDRIPNKFEAQKYLLGTEGATYNPSLKSGYVDPILTASPKLDSLLIIWDTNVLHGIRTILENKNSFNYLKTLNSHIESERTELGYELVDGTLQYVFKKCGKVILKLGEALIESISDFDDVLDLIKCVIRLICAFTEQGYTNEEKAKDFGMFIQSLYCGAYYTPDLEGHNRAMYIPFYGKLTTQDFYVAGEQTPTNPRPGVAHGIRSYWERVVWQEDYQYSLNTMNLDYPKHCISQYQTIVSRDGSTSKTYHGTIKLLYDEKDVKNTLYNAILNL